MSEVLKIWAATAWAAAGATLATSTMTQISASGCRAALASPRPLAAQLLRPRFEHVTFIVPLYAKSAATMLALSGEELRLDEHSELGPIDRQFTCRGGTVSPAKSILSQFESRCKAAELEVATSRKVKMM
jgi:serine dehydrogenase proteinase